MGLNLPQKILVFYLGLLVLFWIWLQQTNLTGGAYNDFYSFSFGLIPLLAGLWGIRQSFSWGGLKSYIGRGIFFISAGSFAWGAGTVGWAYYNFFLSVAIPYPSFADIGYVLAIPLWAYGIFSISRATGSRMGLHDSSGKLILWGVPIGIAAISYYLLVYVARGGVLTEGLESYLKLFFDLAYPIGDVIILTFASVVFLLSRKYLGGQYKSTINILLLGFFFMYFADFIFSYTTTTGAFYTGNFGDLIFTLALFIISFGTLGLDTAFSRREEQ